MHRGPLPRRFLAGGFTLVELVVVIVVLAIMSVGTVQFIRMAVAGFEAGARWSAQADGGRVVIERLARDLRGALPGSVRVNGSCIEYLPVLGASRAVALPDSVPGTRVELIAINPVLENLVGRIAVQPLDAASLYGSSSPGPAPLSGAATLGVAGADNVIDATLDSAHRFPPPGVSERIFVVDDPVSYCQSGAVLYRYENYGLIAAQPLPAALPGALPNRSVLATGLAAVTTPFRVEDGSLTRNAVVQFDLIFGTGADARRYQHEVQLRNVP